jgi:hypothetical protein
MLTGHISVKKYRYLLSMQYYVLPSYMCYATLVCFCYNIEIVMSFYLCFQF